MDEHPAPPVPAAAVDGARRTVAHVAPFAVFMGFILVLEAFAHFDFLGWDHPAAPWWRRAPEHWLYPLQSVVCMVMVLRWWRVYELRWSPRAMLVGAAFGVVGIGFWLLPTTLYDHLGLAGEPDGWRRGLGLAPRTEGFDPWVFASPAACWVALVMRFFRAAVVVALVEEVFWRGFAMRFVLDWQGDYWKQPFGKPSWRSYVVVTGAFMLVHARVDWAGAFVYGSLAYWLCVWTKSLSACVAMHAVANFLMGCHAVACGKHGLW